MWHKPDSGKTEGFTEGLHDAEVRVFGDERSGTGACGCEVDVGFVYDNDPLERLVVENLADGFEGDECAGRIPRRAQEDEFDVWVCVDGFLHLHA